MIIVVDTNIVFSGILSQKGKISDLLLNSAEVFEFYSPVSLIEELDNHHKKLIQLSGLLENELGFLKRLILKK